MPQGWPSTSFACLGQLFCRPVVCYLQWYNSFTGGLVASSSSLRGNPAFRSHSRLSPHIYTLSIYLASLLSQAPLASKPVQPQQCPTKNNPKTTPALRCTRH